MYEAEEIFDAVFPSGDESSEVVEPCEEPFDLPTSSVSAQTAAVLCVAFSTSAIGCDQFDAIVLVERLIERIRIVGLVSDKPRRELVGEASCQNKLHKLALGRRSAVDSNGERKTIARGDSDDLGALAAPRGTDCEATFFALAKVASTNASSKFSLPHSRR